MSDQDMAHPPAGSGALADYMERLAAAEQVVPLAADSDSLAPARRFTLDARDWFAAGRTAAAIGWRYAGTWGDPGADRIGVYACLERQGTYMVLATELPVREPRLASLTPVYPGADRLERHLRDLIGVAFTDQPDPRRWTRHKAWGADRHPLRPDHPVSGDGPARTPADADYPFAVIHGSGVHEIPVGPVHAGIIEPGHFRFQAVGEEVLRLEERLGYTHKGIEKIGVGRTPEQLARLAGRVSGDTTVAHAWAACQAMERAAGCDVPPRALTLRALLCERERIANHLGDIGAVCNDVGFAFAHVQCARLREQWQRRSHALFGHRLLMDCVIPGGLAGDLPAQAREALLDDHRALHEAIGPLFDIVDDHPPLEDRLLGSGRLSAEDARALGCTGYVGKASGQPFDVRRHSPYAPYDKLAVRVPVLTEGDVAARLRVRMAEIRASLELMDRLLEALPEGATVAPLSAPAAGATGLGLVDAWRGEVLCYVRFADDGRIGRFFPRDPSWFSWPALERLIHGNIVPDFPVCNKSVNASYSGTDL